MSTPFDRLMMTITPHLPGAVEQAIKPELYMVCLEFFKNSNVWREDIPFKLLPKRDTADLTPFAGRIERLMYVTHDGSPVRRAFMVEDELIKMPFEATTLTEYVATVALRVADPVSRDAFPIVPYDIVEKYQDTLMSGILSRMMAQPAKPYTNLSLAQFHLQKFRGGISRAKVERDIGSTMNSASWSFPRTFA